MLVYEPVLVNCETNGFQRLDIYALLLAQAQHFASLQKELLVVNADLENRVALRTEQLTADAAMAKYLEGNITLTLIKPVDVGQLQKLAYRLKPEQSQ